MAIKKYARTPLGCVYDVTSPEWVDVQQNNSASYIADCKYFNIDTSSPVFAGLGECAIEVKAARGIDHYLEGNEKPSWLV